MPIAPEHVPTVDKVNAYLLTRAQGDLCKDVVNCNSWPAEAFLMDDLLRYVRNDAPLPQATRAETRLYLRAVSWFTYPTVSETELIETSDRLPNLSAADRALFHEALNGHSKDEALEPAAQRIDEVYGEAWTELQRVRRLADLAWRDIQGAELPDEVKHAKEAVNALRPLRDTIYFHRHLSHWLALTA